MNMTGATEKERPEEVEAADAADFQSAAKPLMKYLAENKHPHTTAIVSANRVELVEGVATFSTDEFLVD